MKNRFLKFGIIVGLSFTLSNAFAFPCYITIAKDNCWTNYNVTVDVLDAANDNVLVTVTIPKGTSWTRKSFESRPKQRIMLRAHFTPAFWKGDAGKSYYATRYWALPEEVIGSTMAWNVGACFPKNFSSVPLPPDAGSNCECDIKEIPQVQP